MTYFHLFVIPNQLEWVRCQNSWPIDWSLTLGELHSPFILWVHACGWRPTRYQYRNHVEFIFHIFHSHLCYGVCGPAICSQATVLPARRRLKCLWRKTGAWYLQHASDVGYISVFECVRICGNMFVIFVCEMMSNTSLGCNEDPKVWEEGGFKGTSWRWRCGEPQWKGWCS